MHHKIQYSDLRCSLHSFHSYIFLCVPVSVYSVKVFMFVFIRFKRYFESNCLCIMYQYSLVVTSLIISAEAWHPLTMCLVQRDRSLVVSARNRWVSMPSRVPVRVAKKSSVPECGDPRSGPECTRLDKHININCHVIYGKDIFVVITKKIHAITNSC